MGRLLHGAAALAASPKSLACTRITHTPGPSFRLFDPNLVAQNAACLCAAWSLQAMAARREKDEAIAKAQMEAALSGGVSWGFGEDAVNEDDDRESAALASLRGWFQSIQWRSSPVLPRCWNAKQCAG